MQGDMFFIKWDTHLLVSVNQMIAISITSTWVSHRKYQTATTSKILFTQVTMVWQYLTIKGIKLSIAIIMMPDSIL